MTVGAAAVQPAVRPGDELALLAYQGRARPEEVAARLAERLAQGGDTPAQRLEALRLLGGLRVTLGLDDGVQQVLAQMDDMARRGPPELAPAATAVALCLRADLQRRDGPLARADELLEQAERMLDARIPLDIRMACTVVHASVEENLGRFDEAVRLTQDALRLVDQGGQPWRRSSLLSGLAYTFYRAGQPERARRYNEEAKALALASEDWVSMAEASTMDGILYPLEGKEGLALQALEDAIEYARRAGARLDEAMGLANLSDHYLRQGDYRQALALAQKALPLAREAKSSEAEQLANNNAGMALIAMGRKAEGLALVREITEQLRRSDEVVSLAETLLDLARYLETAGYHAEALAAYREQRAVAQQAFQRDQQKALLELQESFEAERRRHERSLLTDDNQLKEEALRQSELRFRLWALGALVAGMGVVLLLLAHRRMQATQRALHSVTERLRVQSEQDPLTGLANRRHFQAHVIQAPGTPEPRGTLYLLDLDFFKRINDTHGHAGGDVVLVEVARRLSSVVREQDLVVRWGGEEFMIWVPGSGESAELLAQRLLTALAALPVRNGAARVPVSGSIGFATFPLQPEQVDVSWSVAIDLVDAAMYIAKTQGRNRAVGVRRMPATSEREVLHRMLDLEASWRRGDVDLVELHGPEAVGDAR